MNWIHVFFLSTISMQEWFKQLSIKTGLHSNEHKKEQNIRISKYILNASTKLFLSHLLWERTKYQANKTLNINKSSNEAFMGERVLKDLTGDTSIKNCLFFSVFSDLLIASLGCDYFMVISFVGGSGNRPNYTHSGCILLNNFFHFCLFSMAAW